MAGNLTFSAMESDVWRRHGLQDNHSHLPRQGKRESFLFKKNRECRFSPPRPTISAMSASPIGSGQ